MPPVYSKQLDEPIEFPTTQAEWDAIPDVDEGVKSFRKNAPKARKIAEMGQAKLFPLSVKPQQLRRLIPWLHEFKSKSFDAWFYKRRSSVRIGECGVPKSKPTSSRAKIPSTLAPVENIYLPATTPSKVSPTSVVNINGIPFNARTVVSNKRCHELIDEAEEVSMDGKTMANSTEVYLPFVVAEWKNADLQDMMTLGVWLPSGAYICKYEQAEDVGILKFTLPKTFTPKAMVSPFPRDKNYHARLHAMKEAYSKMRLKPECNVWFHMEIPLHRRLWQTRIQVSTMWKWRPTKTCLDSPLKVCFPPTWTAS